MMKLLLRSNTTSAYFVDGLGTSANHAAIHSSVYASVAGVMDTASYDVIVNLATYMHNHGVAPSSCMMGRHWVTGFYRLGIYSAAAADYALDVLTAVAYPSWLNMIAIGATVTTEAWQPADKSNMVC